MAPLRGRPADGPARAHLAFAALLALLLAPLLAPPAGAELYRCVKPSGELFFTDSPGKCPGARRHDSSGDLQTVETPDPPASRPTAPPAARRDTARQQALEKATWQQKKRNAEADLARAEALRDELQRYVTACNRGMSIIGRDETGMKYTVSCTRIRSEQADNEAKLATLREYLEGGLRRECREAGCLPGWVR